MMMTTSSTGDPYPGRFTAVIVDDERRSREVLVSLLERHCPDVSIIGLAGDAESAMHLLDTSNPDILFLDIEMPGADGFTLLDRLGSRTWKTIFVTGHAEHAIRGYKYAAVDYLLKPVNTRELKETVNRVLASIRNTMPGENAPTPPSDVRKGDAANPTLALPTLDGFLFVEIRDIIRCEAHSNYTDVHLAGNRSVTVSRTLKEYDDLLATHGFVRIHQSHLINLRHLRRYIRGRGGYVVLSDGREIEVSVRKKEEFLLRAAQ